MIAKLESQFWSYVCAVYTALLVLLILATWALNGWIDSWIFPFSVLCYPMPIAFEALFKWIAQKYFSFASKEVLAELRQKWEALLIGLLLWCFVNFHMVEKLPTSLEFARYLALLFVFPLWVVFTPMWLRKGNAK